MSCNNHSKVVDIDNSSALNDNSSPVLHDNGTCAFPREILINRFILVCIMCIYNFFSCATAFANKYPIISYPTSGDSSHFYKVPTLDILSCKR